MTSFADRRHYLGASDIAAVLGLSPYRSPLDVWSEKTAAEAPPQVETEDTLRGHAMEPVIETILRHRGMKLLPGGEWGIEGTPLLVHPDRLVDGSPLVVEMKAPRRWGAWGEDGSDDVPTEYLVQVQVQMAALRANGHEIDSCSIVAMCGELRVYPIPFVQDTATQIVRFCQEWWGRHVVGREEPPAHTAEEINKIVRRRDTAEVGDIVARKIAELKTLRKIESRAKEMGDELRRGLMAELARADQSLPEAIVGPDGAVIANTRRGGRSVVDIDGIRGVDPDLVERFTKRIEWNELRPAKRVPLVQMTPEILAIGDEA